MPSFRDHLLTDEKLDEVLAKADPASKWIRDFVKSDNPKFKGKSKKERIKMALGAYYAKQRNEELQGVAEGKPAGALSEMDKSAPQPGRDGKVSHITYGSRDKKGSDYFKGKEALSKPITKKQMEKHALDILKKQGVAEDKVIESSARERLLRMMQDKAMVKNPPKIPTPAERRAKEQEEKNTKKDIEEARDPSKMSTKAIESEIEQIEKKDYDTTSPEERARHDVLSKEHRYRKPSFSSSDIVSGHEVDKAFKRGQAKRAKAMATQKNEEVLDEISQATKDSYTEKAKAQVKELQPFTKKKSEYRDLAKNLIAKRTAGIAKANEEVEENIDEAVVHDQYDQYNSMAAKKANDIINSLAKHKKAVYQGYPGTEVMKEKGSRMHSGHVMHMKNLCRTLQDIHDGLQMDVENNTPMTPQKVGK